MSKTVESMAAELAAMRSISKNIETNLAKLEPDAVGRVLAWALDLINSKTSKG